MREDPYSIIVTEVNRATVFNWMVENNVKKLTISFNGEGDSGSFDEYISIELNTEKYEQAAYEAAEFSLAGTPAGPMAPDNASSIGVLVRTMSQEIESKTPHGIDWWNNDGGNGEVEWILDGEGRDGAHYKQGICLTVSARVIEYETSFFGIAGQVAETFVSPAMEEALANAQAIVLEDI